MLLQASREPGQEALRVQLSAAMDGEAGPAEIKQVCEAWAKEPCLGADWHAWALCADVLRSEDLAQPAAHDQRFLNVFRERLAQEPVVVAPVVLVAARSAAATAEQSPMRRRWSAPAAVAAGLVAVVGVASVLRVNPGDAPKGGTLVATAVAPPAPSAASTLVLVRSPQIDHYLAAHRQYAQAPGMATPTGLRQVVANSDGR